MINEWTLRDELLLVSHRWPLIILFCLTGSILGLGIAFARPSPHRATKELYVGLNIYQVAKDRSASEHAEMQFRNGDDYKNWQMASLNSLIFMDDVVDETLARLEEEDGYWSGINREELRSMLSVYWRNAGKWRLVAENEDPSHAIQAVTVWEDVSVSRVHRAVLASREALLLDLQLQSIVASLTEQKSHHAKLQQVSEALRDWQTNTVQKPADLPLLETERQSIWGLVSEVNPGASWGSLLEEFPSAQAPYQDYMNWIERILPWLDQELLVSQAQIDSLELESNEIAAFYAEASQTSLGLSADLIVDKITDSQPEQTIVRPVGLVVLIGALLGFVAWSMFWLVNLSLRKSS